MQWVMDYHILRINQLMCNVNLNITYNILNVPHSYFQLKIERMDELHLSILF